MAFGVLSVSISLTLIGRKCIQMKRVKWRSTISMATILLRWCCCSLSAARRILVVGIFKGLTLGK